MIENEIKDKKENICFLIDDNEANVNHFIKEKTKVGGTGFLCKNNNVKDLTGIISELMNEADYSKFKLLTTKVTDEVNTIKQWVDKSIFHKFRWCSFTYNNN